MAKSKLSLENSNSTWDHKRRYKVNAIVTHLGKTWQNLTGKNSEPGVGSDWFLDNSLDNYYTKEEIDVLENRVTVLEDLQGLETNFTGNAYAIWTGVGLIFDVIYPDYYIQGVLYPGTTEQITLIPSDPTNPRLDVIAVDATGAIQLNGDPAPSPSSPTVDSETQIYVSTVFIDAGATTPTGVGNEDVYKENTEWTAVSNIASVNFNATTTPFQGTKHIDCGSFTNNQYLRFTDSVINQTTDYSLLKFYVNLKIVFSNSTKFSVRLFNGTTLISSTIVINSGSYGFDRNVINSYQTVIIPFSDFNFTSSSFNRIEIVMVGTNASGFRMDNISLVQGADASSPEQNALTTIVTDSGVANATTKDDVFQFKGFGGLIVSAIGKVISFTNNSVNRTGNFTGIFDLTETSNIYYSDYISGSVVNLSIASSPVLGSIGTVRIKGNLLGTVPSTWNLSGQPITNISSKLNELTIMYVNDLDIRIVNRVVPFNDVTPPSVPLNVILVSKTGTTISFSWDASTDEGGISGYKIYVNGVYNSTTSSLSKTLNGLTISTNYSIQVSAIDTSSNESAKSTALSVTTDASDPYETEYQAVLDYATDNGFDLPDTTQKYKDNLKVKYLKNIGAWSSLDTVRIFNATYSPTSWAKNMYRLNFKNPALYPVTATAGLEPTFTSGSGFSVVGGSGKFAKLGFIPSTHGVNFTGTNCSEILGLFNIPTTFSVGFWATGGRISADSTQILIGTSTEDSFFYRIGAAACVFNVLNSDLNAHFHGYKKSGLIRLSRNGGAEMIPSLVSGVGTSLTAGEQYIFGINDNGTLLSSAMNVGLKYHLMGSALDTLKNEIYQILNETYVP